MLIHNIPKSFHKHVQLIYDVHCTKSVSILLLRKHISETHVFYIARCTQTSLLRGCCRCAFWGLWTLNYFSTYIDLGANKLELISLTILFLEHISETPCIIYFLLHTLIPQRVYVSFEGYDLDLLLTYIWWSLSQNSSETNNLVFEAYLGNSWAAYFHIPYTHHLGGVPLPTFWHRFLKTGKVFEFEEKISGLDKLLIFVKTIT